MNRALIILIFAGLSQWVSPVPTHAAEAETIALVTLGKSDARARALMLQKRWVEAARAITARSASARLVKAYALLEGNRTGEGLDAMPDITAIPLPLHDFHHQVHARLLLAEGLFDRAIAIAAELRDGGPYHWMKRRVTARALRESGALDASEEAYDALVKSGQSSEQPVGKLGLARLNLDRGQTQKAVALFLELDIHHPTHWTAHQARKEMKRLLTKAPRVGASWHNRRVVDRITRAEKLLDKHRNKQAVTELSRLKGIQVTGALACRMQYAQARALRKLRKWKRADPLAEAAVKSCRIAQHELAPWAIHLAGKTAERIGAENRAAAHYTNQMKTHPRHRLADDAGYFLVRHLIEDRNDLKGAREMASQLVSHWPEGDMTVDAVFFVVTHALLKKRVRFAQEVLELDAQLDQSKLPYTRRSRSAYWRARIQQMLGERKGAIAGYQSVISAYPLGWYALLSYSRLREINRKRARRFVRKHLGQGGTVPDFLAQNATSEGLKASPWSGAVWMARLGLASAAWKALKGELSGIKSTLWTAAQVLHGAGAHHLSHRIMRWQLPEYRNTPPTGSTEQAWHIAYPQPFAGLVQRAAKNEGVDSSFIWGVMREESSFKASAESFANAIGLMQLIMPTAKHVAEPKDGPINRRQLTQPALNIKLGARYLAEVGEKSGAVSFLWPAGYNAGTGALKRWLKQKRHLPLDLFVEAIPYEEARGYTKRVNASRATYGFLYGKKGKDPLPYISQRLLTKKARAKSRKKSRKKKRKKRRSRRRRGKK